MTEELLNSWVSAVNHILWDYLLIYGLIGIGLFFTLYLGVPQITRFGEGMKQVFGGLFKKREGGKDQKSLSSFQALAVAISAQIGTGNVAGVATDIADGLVRARAAIDSGAARQAQSDFVNTTRALAAA